MAQLEKFGMLFAQDFIKPQSKYLMLLTTKIPFFVLECQICNRDMTEVRRGNLRSNIWRCPSHKASKRGIMTGSFFENSNLSFTQMVGLLHNFAKETSLTKCASSLELDRKTVCLWYKVNIAYFIVLHWDLGHLSP